MSKFFKRLSRTAGLAPGTLVHVGEEKRGSVRITVFNYDEEQAVEKEIDPSRETARPDVPGVTWLNVDGIHRTEIIEEIGKSFGLHPLVQEDIVNSTQRPKVEDFGEYLLIVVKMMRESKEAPGEIYSEQVSIVLGNNYVISFQEREGDLFGGIRDRIKTNKGRVRKSGADYLAYALLDAVVDGYFIVLEKLGDRLETMEEEILDNPGKTVSHRMHALKRELIFLRKSVWPLREAISGLRRAESPLIKESTKIYLNDLYDHTIQVIDTVETFRDMLSGMLDIYLSSISNKMNEVMKVLTIIATIFIPLTFIAGVYGMNFEYMPELSWRSSYFIVLGIMAAVGFSMLMYFKRKRWL